MVYMMWLMLLVVGVLMSVGIPVPIALMMTAGGFMFLSTGDFRLLVSGMHRMSEGIMSFPLLAIPFFIFVGLMMNEGGMTTRLFKFAKCFVGHFRGGLAHVNVLNSMIFAGMSGSAVADAAGIGVMEIKAMVDDGYDVEFSAGLSAASSTIGPVIPPSIPFVIYGWLTGVSVGKLFLAGLIPGVAMGLCMMFAVAILARKKNFPRHPRVSSREFFRSTVDAIFALICPVIIIGGIVGGFFTPTEAAAVAAFYSIIIVVFVYREATLKDVVKVMFQTIQYTVKIMFTMAAAAFFGWVILFHRVPSLLADSFLSFSTNPLIIVCIIAILVLILGCFIEGVAIMLLLVPMFLPLLTSLQIDLIYFGVVLTLSIMIGLCTPPFGLSLYAVSAVTGKNIFSVFRAMIPFVLGILVPLIAAILFPEFSLFIPSLLMK